MNVLFFEIFACIVIDLQRCRFGSVDGEDTDEIRVDLTSSIEPVRED